MSSRAWTFSAMAGIKFAWSIDAFYNKKNNNVRLVLGNESIYTNADVLRLNTTMLFRSTTGRYPFTSYSHRRRSAYRGASRMCPQGLRGQTRNGVVDTTVFLDKITDESTAAVNGASHRIEHVRAIYKLIYTQSIRTLTI